MAAVIVVVAVVVRCFFRLTGAEASAGICIGCCFYIYLFRLGGEEASIEPVLVVDKIIMIGHRHRRVLQKIG